MRLPKSMVPAYRLWVRFLYGLGHVAFLVFIAPFFHAGELYQRWMGKEPPRLPPSPTLPKDRNSPIVACYLKSAFETTEDSGDAARAETLTS